MRRFQRLLTATLIGLAAFGFASCEKDKDKDDDANVNLENVAGTYQGSTAISVPAQPGVAIETVEMSVTLAGQSNGKLTISIPEVSYTLNGREMQLSGFELRDVGAATGENGSVIIPTTPIDLTVGGMQYTGALSGKVLGGRLSLDYTLKPGQMPFEILFEFESR